MQGLEQKITSLEVAEMIGKQHKNLMADIRNYVSNFAELKIQPGDFFTENTYLDKNKQERPCFDVSKKGCEFIAHKLTGAKGTEFTVKYINRFHEMEEVIKKPMSAIELLKLQQEALIEVDEKITNLSDDFEGFKQELPLLGVDMDEITNAVRKRGVDAMGGKDSLAYHDATIRGQVYSDIYKELKRQFNCHSYKALRRNQLQQALEIIEEYEMPLYLQQNVETANSQMRLA